jgi:F-type H+-transporting ATPase subunit b
MIDIDIVEQLIPNPLTMLVQLCSTLVLFLLMKKLLWKSVKDYLQARSDKMQEDLTAQEAARTAAESDREAASLQLQQAGSRSEEIVAAAVREAGSQRETILADAERDAESVRKRAHEQIEQEREEMYSDMRREMVEVALTAASTLLSGEKAENLDRQAIDAFVKEATDGK